MTPGVSFCIFVSVLCFLTYIFFQMDRAGSSGGNRQSLTPPDTNFGSRIRRLLHPLDYDESGVSYDEGDDSDADPTCLDPAQGNVPEM